MCEWSVDFYLISPPTCFSVQCLWTFTLEGISVWAVSDNMDLVSKILKRCYIVSCFDQILSLVNCLRTLRRLKGRATAVHNESIPHHCNFDKGAEFLAKFWVVRTGIKILPTGFLCHSRAKSPVLVGVQLLLMVAGRRAHNTDLSERKVRNTGKYWKLRKTWKALQKYLKHCWIYRMCKLVESIM